MEAVMWAPWFGLVELRKRRSSSTCFFWKVRLRLSDGEGSTAFGAAEVAVAVATITLDHPGGNRINFQMREEIYATDILERMGRSGLRKVQRNSGA
jgi:hypothetical protein